jgi:hypothetical protein
VLGFGELTGDATPAAIYAIGDGVVFLDNKETKNQSEFVDWLLFVATGAERQRADRSGMLRRGSKGRPIVIVTCIEGLSSLTELARRNVEFEFEALSDEKVVAFSEKENKKAILTNRDKIMSGIALVLRKFLADGELYPCLTPPVAIRDFGDNWRTLCKLMHAYADVASKPDGWADEIITAWVQALGVNAVTGNEELESLVRRFLDAQQAKARQDKEEKEFFMVSTADAELSFPDYVSMEVTYKGQRGRLAHRRIWFDKQLHVHNAGRGGHHHD